MGVVISTILILLSIGFQKPWNWVEQQIVLRLTTLNANLEIT